MPRPDLPPESAYFLQANRNKRSYVILYHQWEGWGITLIGGARRRARALGQGSSEEEESDGREDEA